MVDTGVTLGQLLSAMGLGAGTVGVVARYLMARWFEQRDRAFQDMAADLKAKNTAEIQDIKSRVAKVEDGCKAHQHAQELTRQGSNLDNLVGWMKKNDLVLSEIRDGVAGLKASAEADRRWLANLNEALNSHKSDHKIHGIHHG